MNKNNKKRLSEYLIYFSITLPVCLIFPTIQYKEKTFQSYRNILWSFSNQTIDPWGLIVDIVLALSLVLLLIGMKIRKKCR